VQPCEVAPNRAHTNGCGLYARIDFDQPNWEKRCSVVRPVWPFKQDDIILGLVWAGGHIIEHEGNVIRAQTMEILLIAGAPRVADKWRDHYITVPSKHWEQEAEAALRYSTEHWLREPAASSSYFI
jgi:hypothetical protein